MGHRLSRIYTRTGDGGTTGLGDGSRVPKDHLRVAAMGDVDELNSTLGVLLCEPLPAEVATLLTEIQHDLFDLGGELSIPGWTAIGEAHLAALERALDVHNAALPPLKEFILPGGTRAAALAHVGRTVCRRAERSVVTLAAATAGDAQPLAPLLQQYLNRLSDLMFVLSRVLNRVHGGTDVLWDRTRTRAAAAADAAAAPPPAASE
ncbi:MAG: cob(I)yrinic acid a,c-diamide adenosyltransferase [Burkholderiales bacterium]|jgi:cob(I)alamin adenosyltransferase|nr:cob(I)yrinic acid a,c-diamide adenosyltransferase [Burkholderiales bacterium]